MSGKHHKYYLKFGLSKVVENTQESDVMYLSSFSAYFF